MFCSQDSERGNETSGKRRIRRMKGKRRKRCKRSMSRKRKKKKNSKRLHRIFYEIFGPSSISSKALTCPPASFTFILLRNASLGSPILSVIFFGS